MIGPLELIRRARAAYVAIFGEHEWRCWGCGAVAFTNVKGDNTSRDTRHPPIPCYRCALAGKRWDRPSVKAQ